MDGNGRWAKLKGLPRSAGHREGALRVREITRFAAEQGVRFLTLFAFSTENWNRPKNEVNMLMRFLTQFLKGQSKELKKNNIRFLTIGEKHPLPDFVLQEIERVKEQTCDNTGLVLVLALNYGSRQEIIEACRKISASVSEGKLFLKQIDEKVFSKALFTDGIPDPDLLIRTSGEMRISNFLLWQLSYAELYFPKKYWPDFRQEDFKKAISVYAKRERRFGKVDVY